MFALRTLVGLFVVVASASTAAPGPTPKAAPWTKVGPSNIGDDIHQVSFPNRMPTFRTSSG